ncbi:hypothetical protein ACLBX9_09650 [Methylobacterium sp. A49B]
MTPPRFILACFAIGAVDLAWAAFLSVMVERGFVRPWLGYGVPVMIIAGLNIWAWAAVCWRRIRNSEKAAHAQRTALAYPHAPVSLAALARDPGHCSVDLLARPDR